MRAACAILLISGMAFGQAADAQKPSDAPQATETPAQHTNGNNGAAPQPALQDATPASVPPAAPASQPDPNAAVIPAGTKIPLSLKQAISTKNAHEGDAIYAETVFPFVLNERVLVPSGTYIQGKISHTEHAGRMKQRAEILVHFTSMIFPSGYTVMLAGSVENTPGADNKGVKDSEGTIQQDKDTGKRVEDAAKNGTYGTIGGATAGGLAGGLNGARIGGGVGAAAGVAWALLKHGNELRLDVGTSIEMEIQRDVPLDMSRVTLAKATR
jgi:outer membrane lipoprotein SlyB